VKNKLVPFTHLQSSCGSKYTLECNREAKFKILFEKILQPVHSKSTLQKDNLQSTYNERSAAV
jgi:hypothetical protein